MEKNKILSKFNLKMKDYNNELEKILETKLFSFDVKNLLLSMLYKIENAYEDYKTTKVEVPSKDEYIENILRIIQEKCLKIFLVKPGTKEAEKLEQENQKYLIDKENGEITCFQNELAMLNAIFKIDETDLKNFDQPYEFINIPLSIFMNSGKLDSETEVIRDFNGWSWDVTVKDINDIENNFIYQNLLLLNGRKNIITTKRTEEFNNLIMQLAVKNYILKSGDKKFVSNLKKIKKEKNERFKLFEDKKHFLTMITDEKKQYTKQIERIDKILNNNELLKKEYYSRNEKLPDKEKIFSISFLVKKLEEERKESLKKIEENNKLILPKGFIEHKTKIEREVNFLNSVFVKEDTDQLVDISKEFLKIVKENVNLITEENKKELVIWIYKLRYYRYIPISKDKCVKDMKELTPRFRDLIKLIIKRAQTLKIWEVFIDESDINYQILKEVFDSKIVRLENINLQFKTEDKKLIVEYYDDTVIENSIKINKEITKIKKKVKLFI